MARRKKSSLDLSAPTTRIGLIVVVVLLVGGFAFFLQSSIGDQLLGAVGMNTSKWCPSPIKSSSAMGPNSFSASADKLLEAKNKLFKQAREEFLRSCQASVGKATTCPLARKNNFVCAAQDEPQCSVTLKTLETSQRQLTGGGWVVSGSFSSTCSCAVSCAPEQQGPSTNPFPQQPAQSAPVAPPLGQPEL